MSARGEDELRIPIEIKTEDIAELRDIIAGLKEAQQDARSAVPTTRAKAQTGEQRTATRTQPFEERGGIFGGEVGKQQAFKDKTSKAATQRESAFSELKKQVGDIQDTQVEGLSAFDAIFGGAILSQGRGGQAMKGVGQAGAAVRSGGMGMLGGLASRLIPVIIPLMLAFGFVTTITNELIKPGGVFDRRLRINVEDQFFKLADRKETAEFREGVRELRVTAVTGQRGPSPVSNVKDFFRRGTPFIHSNQEALDKGLLP